MAVYAALVNNNSSRRLGAHRSLTKEENRASSPKQENTERMCIPATKSPALIGKEAKSCHETRPYRLFP